MKKNGLLALLVVILFVGAGVGAWIYLHSNAYQDAIALRNQKAWDEKQSSQMRLEGSWIAQEEGYDLVVWRDKDELFHAQITRTAEDGTTSFWECSGKYSDGDEGFRYFDGSRETLSYDMDGNEKSEEVYRDGSGRIFYRKGSLYWEDDKEDMGKDITFSFEGDY